MAEIIEVKAYVEDLVKKSRAAQRKFEREYQDQRAIDEVVRAIGMACYKNMNELAELAVAESRMGSVQDEMGKIWQLSTANWNFLRGKTSVGEIPNVRPDEPGVRVYCKPLGVLGCIMPSTNPTGTVIGNAMPAIKARNSVIIAPHPATAKTSYRMTELIREALKEVGAPVDLVQCISPEMCCVEASGFMLDGCDANIGTGGPGMVKAVYSCGKPGFGVGQGNSQVLMDEEYPDYATACNIIVNDRAFQNGIPCPGEQTVHVPASREEEFLKAMEAGGAYLITSKEDIDKLRDLVFPTGKPVVNRKIVGRPAQEIGAMVGIEVPEKYKLIMFKNQCTDGSEVLCHEIIAPFIRYTTYEKFEDAVDTAVINLELGGAGHSSGIFSNNAERIELASRRVPVSRFHINQGTVGNQTGLPISSTYGCGVWGGNSVCENLQYYHLMQETRVTTFVPNLRPFDPSDWDNFDICPATAD